MAWTKKTNLKGTPGTTTHTGLTDVTSDQHHVKYTDAEAVTAMGAEGNSNALHHRRFTQVEVLQALGARENGNPAYHNRYEDDEAAGRIDRDHLYVKVAGDTMTGGLKVTNGSIKMLSTTRKVHLGSSSIEVGEDLDGGGVGRFSNIDFHAGGGNDWDARIKVGEGVSGFLGLGKTSITAGKLTVTVRDIHGGLDIATFVHAGLVIGVDGVLGHALLNPVPKGASAPPYGFNGVGGTGMSTDAAKNLIFSVGGQNRFEIQPDAMLVTKRIRPAANGGADLGTDAIRWATIYTRKIQSVSALVVASLAADKDNLRDMPDSGELIDALAPQLWERDDETAAGFTVEQWKAHGAVDGWNPATGGGIRYSELIAPLWSEVRKLRKRVAVLESA